MREHDGHVAAHQEDFANEHARTAAIGEHETLVAVGTPQTLEEHLHAYVGTARGDAGGERSAVGQPRAIGARGRRRGLP